MKHNHLSFSIPMARDNVFAEAFARGGAEEIDHVLVKLLFPNESMAPTGANLNRLASAHMIIGEHRVTVTRDLSLIFKAACEENKKNEAAIETMRELHTKMQVTIKDLESEMRQAREARGLYVSKELEEAKKTVLAAELKAATETEALAIQLSEAKRGLAENEHLLHTAQMELSGMRAALKLQEASTSQLMGAVGDNNTLRDAVLATIAEAEEKFAERYGAKAPPFHTFAWKHIKDAVAILKGEKPVVAEKTNGHTVSMQAAVR